MAKNHIHKLFKVHKKLMVQRGQLTKGVPIKDQSYSILRSMDEGFSMLLYTGTHIGLPKDKVHRNNAVRLILGRDMVMIWSEPLLHSMGKSREMDGDNHHAHKEDKRCCAYVWPSTVGQATSRSKGKMNSGKNIHSLKTNICNKWKSRDCKECNKEAKVIDLRSIKGYQVGLP